MQEVSKKRKAVEDVNELKFQKKKTGVLNNEDINSKEEEESITFNIFDFNILSNVFTFVTIPYDTTHDSVFKENFTFCNNFALVSKLFNEISNQTKFKYNLNQNTVYINYKIYLKLNFLKSKFSYEVCSFDGITYRILIDSSKNGFYGVIEFLLKNTKNITQETLDKNLLESCKYGHLKTSKILLSYGSNINYSSNVFREIPLHNAIQSRNIELVEYLIKKNANIESQDRSQRTPIFRAIGMKSLDVVKFLLYNNCNLNHKDNDGNTALLSLLIIIQGFPKLFEDSTFEIMEFIISQPNLDLHSKNNENKTALDIAIQGKNEKIIDLIKKYLEK